jgi:hypothetical protein
MHGDNRSAVDMAIWFHEPGKPLDAYLRYCWCVSENLVKLPMARNRSLSSGPPGTGDAQLPGHD